MCFDNISKFPVFFFDRHVGEHPNEADTTRKGHGHLRYMIDEPPV